jgi:hypothetical protein
MNAQDLFKTACAITNAHAGLIRAAEPVYVNDDEDSYLTAERKTALEQSEPGDQRIAARHTVPRLMLTLQGDKSVASTMDEQWITNAWLDACASKPSERERVIAFAFAVLNHREPLPCDCVSFERCDGSCATYAERAVDKRAKLQTRAVDKSPEMQSDDPERAAFEEWAPSQHMRTERWTVNPELYDDENAISAWQGFQAGAAWARGTKT